MFLKKFFNMKIYILFRGCFILFIGVICLHVFELSIFSQSSNIEKFFQLSENEQKIFLTKCYKERMYKLRNFYYQVEISTDYFNKELKKNDGISSYFKYKHWLLNNTYKMLVEASSDKKADLDQWGMTSFDINEGVRRSTAHHDATKVIFGRIDTVQDDFVANNNYWRWLYDVFCDDTTSSYINKDSYIFPYLLEHINECKIENLIDEKKIQISMDYKPNFQLASYTGQKNLSLTQKKDIYRLKVKPDGMEILIMA
jgi:hypothetical protein